MAKFYYEASELLDNRMTLVGRTATSVHITSERLFRILSQPFEDPTVSFIEINDNFTKHTQIFCIQRFRAELCVLELRNLTTVPKLLRLNADRHNRIIKIYTSFDLLRLVNKCAI